MADAIHIRAILEQNPYDSEAKRKLIEIGSLDDLKWLYKQYPYSSEIKRMLLQKGTGKHIRAILEQNPYDSEAKRKLIEIGSLDDLKWLYKQYPYSSEIKRALLNYEPKKNNSNHHSIKKYDVFISHATEDKQSFVEPLANALKEVGIKVWYDGFVLEWGDGLRDSIDRGLVNSKYGIVVFSKAYLI